MKRLIALAVAVAVLGIGIGPTFAAEPPRIPAKCTEGPDVRAKVPPKDLEGSNIGSHPVILPKGNEGPGNR